jgi:hypothetical protein
VPGAIGVALCALLGIWSGCGLFEPRPPEDPSQGGVTYPPATDWPIVIANMQRSIDQKSVLNYVQCFADPMVGPKPFVFIPSAEGTALYAPVFQSWSKAEEEAYFRNLTAQTTSTSLSGLALVEKNRFPFGDSLVIDYDYTLTFEHTAAGFPTRASGNLQFALQRNAATNIWTIYRWVDNKTTNEASWSLFKGKFSN